MARASEILEPILRMTVPSKIASKVTGVPYPDYNRKKVANFQNMSFCNLLTRVGGPSLYLPGDYEWKASEKWRKQATQNERIEYEPDVGEAHHASALSFEVEFWEPLNLGCFSCIPQVMNTATLPSWHPYAMSGVGIPNVNRIVINA